MEADYIQGGALARQLHFVYPEMLLVIVASVLFLGGAFRACRCWGWVALAGIAGAGLVLAFGPAGRSSMPSEFHLPLLFDSLTCLTRWVALGGGAILVLFSWNEVPEQQATDYLACLLVIIAGTSLTAASNDLVTLFLALEMVSIPTYILLYLPKSDNDAQEAALKYFLLSVFSSGLMLFGFSYLYGLCGSTNLSVIQNTLNQQPSAKDLPAVAQLALITIVAGLGFRITAAPFHFYAPDVYQGTATVSASMLAFIPKVVGFAALIRVLGFVLPPGIEARDDLVGLGLSTHVPILLWFLAALTMFVGNLLALQQDNLKRLLAYSSIAHAGYMLVSLSASTYLHKEAGPDGIVALLFYIVAYGAMTIGAFAVIAYLDHANQRVETVDDLAGLSVSHPGIALFMALFLFSLIGIPLTAGFTGKFLIFFGAMAVPSADHAWLYRVLALIGMLNAAIGGWYYLRIVAIMYLRNPLRPLEVRTTWSGLLTIWICAILTVGLSMPPGSTWLMGAAHRAANAKDTPTQKMAQAE